MPPFAELGQFAACPCCFRVSERHTICFRPHATINSSLDRGSALSTFSVIICTYNRATSVKSAVHSVLDQTFSDFELLVVVDGSTDDTMAVLDAFDDDRLTTIDQENAGLSAARNTGLAAAAGDWVVFLDDDDRAASDWLDALASATGGDVGLISCGVHHVDPSGRRLSSLMPETHDLFPDVRGVFLAGAFAVRRQLYDAVGGYAESIPTSHQTEIMLRLLPELYRQGLTAVAVDRALIDIETRAPIDRPLSQPRDLLTGAEYLIEHHGEMLATAPDVLADYHAVAGVSAAQIGEFTTSRRHLLAACRVSRWRPKHVSRLGLTLAPPLASRIWGRHHRQP